MTFIDRRIKVNEEVDVENIADQESSKLRTPAELEDLRNLAAADQGIDPLSMEVARDVKKVVRSVEPIKESEEELTDDQLAYKAAMAALNGF